METNLKNKNKEEYSSIIIGKLLNISGILQRESNRLLLPYQLNQQQFSILFEVGKAKKVQQKNVVNRLQLEKAHVSKVLKKLHNMGLIVVTPTPDDKRSALLSTTKQGDELIKKCQAVFGKWKKECLGQFNTEELEEILRRIDQLQKAFTDICSK